MSSALTFLTVAAISANNASSFAAVAGPVSVEDTTTSGSILNRFSYSGTWTPCTGCQPATANSSYNSTTASGATATLRFNGTQANIFGIESSSGGIVNVKVDGGTGRQG